MPKEKKQNQDFAIGDIVKAGTEELEVIGHTPGHVLCAKSSGDVLAYKAEQLEIVQKAGAEEDE